MPLHKKRLGKRENLWSTMFVSQLTNLIQIICAKKKKTCFRNHQLGEIILVFLVLMIYLNSNHRTWCTLLFRVDLSNNRVCSQSIGYSHWKLESIIIRFYLIYGHTLLGWYQLASLPPSDVLSAGHKLELHD